MTPEKLQGVDVIHETVGNHVEPVDHSYSTEIETTQDVVKVESCFAAAEGDRASLEHSPLKGSFVTPPTNEATVAAAGQSIVRVTGRFLATQSGKCVTCCELSPEQSLRSVTTLESGLVTVNGTAVLRGR